MSEWRLAVSRPAVSRCAGCGGAFEPRRWGQACCSRRCRWRWADRRKRSPADPEIMGLDDALSELRVVYVRDRGRCGICRARVDLGLPHRHRQSATVDHVIARVYGGGDEFTNLQLAHWGCNARKGAR